VIARNGEQTPAARPGVQPTLALPMPASIEEVSRMSFGLLGAHVNAVQSELPETIQVWKPPLVVVLDHSDVWHDVKAASPQTRFVGRLYQESEPDFGQPDLNPLVAADDYCRRLLPWAERMGPTYNYWQGVNEPDLRSAAAMQRYAEFEAERARLMDREGFRVVVGSFAVGTPELDLWQHFLPALEAALQYRGALALHEYAWPTLSHEAPWYLLRHRKVYGGEPTHHWAGLPRHLRGLPLLITECGLDGLLERPDQPRGWRARYAGRPESYLRELAWYDAELGRDLYVEAAALYCCGAGGGTWQSYDIWPELARMLTSQAQPIYRTAQAMPYEPQTAAEWQARVVQHLDKIIDLLQQWP
jgi:hypothetical protein